MDHQGTVELETERLILRRFCHEDFGNSAGAYDEAGYRLISRSPRRPEDMAQFLAGAEEAYAAPDTYYWALERKDTHEVVGEVFVDDFGERNRWCEVDYQLGPAFWGRGYAAEALKAAIAFLIGRVGFHRVQAKCSARNSGSLRVMEKAGMRREGVLRGFFRRKDGPGYDDVVICSILAEELGLPRRELPGPARGKGRKEGEMC